MSDPIVVLAVEKLNEFLSDDLYFTAAVDQLARTYAESDNFVMKTVPTDQQLRIWYRYTALATSHLVAKSLAVW